MDASFLLTALADRVAAPAVPGAVHPDVRAVGARVDGWAIARGLVLGDPDASPLGRARFERLACRLFPDAPADDVELFARWLVWFFALDDAIDDAPLGGSATAVHRLYGDLLNALRRGHARPEARPLECALAELWRATGRRMGRRWRRRFLLHMQEHRDGCAAEAVNRRTGRSPGLTGYPPLRRRAAGPFLYDLVEPVLGVELPDEVLPAPAWYDLLEGTADMITWANDVVSAGREAALAEGAGVPNNLVAVACAEYQVDPDTACRWVADRIALRSPQVHEAARVLAADLERLGVEDGRRQDAAAVVRALLLAPRAHLDWLAETGRYIVPAGGAPVPPARGRSRLPELPGLPPAG